MMSKLRVFLSLYNIKLIDGFNGLVFVPCLSCFVGTFYEVRVTYITSLILDFCFQSSDTICSFLLPFNWKVVLWPYLYLFHSIFQENGGNEEISHTYDNVPRPSQDVPPTSLPDQVSSVLGQLNITPEVANILQSFQQGGTLPPNLDPATAQNMLASIMVSALICSYGPGIILAYLHNERISLIWSIWWEDSIELTFRQRPDIASVGRLFHYDVTIQWPVKWLRSCDVTMEWRQKTTWITTCPDFC